MNEEMDNNLMDKSAQMGIENGKRALKKAQKKAQKTLKALWKAIPLKIRLIIIAVIAAIVGIILLCAMAWYVIEDLSIRTSTDEQYNAVASGDYNTFIQIQATTEEIEQFLQECGSDNTGLKDELLKAERITQIEQWQTNTKYNAILLIAIIFEEQVPEDNLDAFIAEINTKGQKWKNAGYTTVQQIAEDYVGDDTATEWANSVIARMSNSNIFADKANGNGYTGIYAKATFAPEIPKRYREYKQIQGSYKDHVWIRYTNSSGAQVATTIKQDGCCLTSIATIVSGYKNQDISPLDIVMQISGGVGYMNSFSPETALAAYGLTYRRPYSHNYRELTNAQKQAIINHVATGKPVIIYVLGGSRGFSSFTTSQHWMAILDYDKANDKLYVSNPSSTLSDKTGWLDSSYVLTSCTEYIAITN